MKIKEKIFEYSYNYLSGSKISRIPGILQLFSRILSLFNIKLFTETDGLKIRVLPTSDNKLLWYSEGYYRPNVTTLFDSIVKEGMTVVDIGASLGYFTLKASKRVGSKGLVYSFEPDKHRFLCLIDAIKANNLSNIKAFQLAVSDLCCEKCLYLTNTSSGASFSSEVKYETSLQIETVTLDSFLKINSVNIVKIDAEGGELEVLKGMRTLLSKGQTKIICKIYPYLTSSLGYDIKEIDKILKEYKYNTYQIKEEGKTIRVNKVESGDYLFTK